MQENTARSNDKVAIVTGATKGIGQAIAQKLSDAGYNLVVTSRSLESAKSIASELTNTNSQSLGVSFDIERYEDLDQLFRQTVAHFGRLDCLVNNAVSQACLIPSADYADDKTLATLTHNIGHSYLLAQKAFPLLQQTTGSIVNIGSVVINRHLQGLPLYGLVKGSLQTMTRVLAAEWAAARVRVNMVNPGFVRSQAFADLGMGESTVDRAYAFYSQYQPLNGIVKADAVADTVAFLLSGNAEAITGCSMDVDNGYSNKPNPLYVPS